jgi:hypothetical protein
MEMEKRRSGRPKQDLKRLTVNIRPELFMFAADSSVAANITLTQFIAEAVSLKHLVDFVSAETGYIDCTREDGSQLRCVTDQTTYIATMNSGDASQIAVPSETRFVNQRY